MEGAEIQPDAIQPPDTESSIETQALKKKKNKKRNKPQHSADIVFTRGTTITTIASLAKLLKDVTEPIIGLQYVWEYRSPSRSVPPHYQCKLCAVARLQHDMLAHVKGWKHSFRYIKRSHPDKITCEEEEATKDPVLRKEIKEAAAEVEKTNGRGQLKIILREPCDIPAFKGLRSVYPKYVSPGGPGMPPKGPPFGSRYSNSGGMFPGDYPSHGGPFSGLPPYGEPGIGGYSLGPGLPGLDMDLRRFPDSMSGGGGDDFGMNDGRDGCGNGGPFGENPGRCYPDEFRGNQMWRGSMNRPMDQPMDRSMGRSVDGPMDGPMGRPMDGTMGRPMDGTMGRPMDGTMGRPMDGPMARPLDQSMDRQVDRPVERSGLLGAVKETNSLPGTLLSYLDTFRIENENDAQVVLKVTQKLTDVLMEYRLRSVSSGPSMNSSLNNSKTSVTGYSPPSPRKPSGGDRFSDNLMGPSRFF